MGVFRFDLVAITVCLTVLLPSWSYESVPVEDGFEFDLSAVNTQRTNLIALEDELENWVGTSLVTEIKDAENEDLLRDAVELEATLVDAAKNSELTVLSSSHHQFEGNGEGATAVVLLSESHIAAHTWPEYDYVALDVFTCGPEEKAKAATEFIRRAFNGSAFVSGRIPRGAPQQKLINRDFLGAEAAVSFIEEKTKNNEFVGGTVSQVYSSLLDATDIGVLTGHWEAPQTTIESTKSEYQHIEFTRDDHNNDTCLVLDGITQICESYSNHYSEVYVHLPAAFLDQLESVLIIGGGDALALAEVLKYGSVKRVIQLELDPQVPLLSQKYFGVNAHLPGGENSDPRVQWVFGDAAKTIDRLISQGVKFDIVLMDISETGPSDNVSSNSFFARAQKVLSPRGIFIKNEPYIHQTAAFFNEFLEIKYPLPVLSQQTFCLGSNQTSLLIPTFKVLDENEVHTTFLAHGPATQFVQYKSMVRRYSKRDVDYESHIEERMNRLEAQKKKESQGKDSPKKAKSLPIPCVVAAESDPDVVVQSKWRRSDCSVTFDNQDVHLEFHNQSPDTVHIGVLGEQQEEDRNVEVSVLGANLQPGDKVDLEFFAPRGKLIVFDATSQDTLGMFEIVSQLVTHPIVEYKGVHEQFIAVRRRS